MAVSADRPPIGAAVAAGNLGRAKPGRSKRRPYLMVALLALAATSVVAQPPDAQDVLARAARALGAAQALTVRLEVTVTSPARPGEAAAATPAPPRWGLDVSFARPNRLHLVAKLGIEPLTLVSDGEKLALAGYPPGRVTEQPVPAALVTASDAEHPTLVDAVLAQGLPGGLARVIAAALTPDPLAAMTRGAAPAFVATEDVDGVSCHRLSLPVDGRTVSLWVDAGGTPLIRKASVEIPPPTEGEGGDARPRAPSTASFSATWDLSPTLPPDAFAIPTAATPEPARTGPARTGLLGDYATDFTGKLLDGSTYQLTEHVGRELVVLAFWSPSDRSRTDLLAMLAKIGDDYRGRKVSVCTVGVSASAEAAKDVLREAGVTVAVVPDPDGAIARTWGITSTPVTILTAADARVHLVAEGLPAWLPGRLHDLLDRLLEHAPPPTG